MSSTKKILVVDDYFEMLSFLRSMLELSNKAYQVMGVPSAEEGMLELRQTKFDLLITDLRLPGISGFDLIRRVRRIHPDIPIIMITGYSSEQGEQEASQLGVFRYFRKPLDTDTLLAAVSEALYGRRVQVAKSEMADLPKGEQISPDIPNRLLMLRADTGAVQVVLMGMDGQVMYDTGGGGRLDMPALALTIVESTKSGFALARQLGSHTPFTIQYQEGQAIDVYTANVGENHILSIFFDAHGRRGRIGTVWVFAQRAIKDIQPLLATLKTPIPSTPTKPAITPQPEKPTPPSPKKTNPKETTPATIPTPKSKPKQAAAIAPEPPPPPANPQDLELDAFWDAAIQSEIKPPKDSHLVSFTEAQLQGLLAEATPISPTTTASLPDNPAEAKKETVVPAQNQPLTPASSPINPQPALDLDNFWDQALEQNEATQQKALSWEQALQLGLIPRQVQKD